MKQIQTYLTAWSAHRIKHLDKEMRYEDSYALSQEFCEWITCFDTYPEGINASTLEVPDFNKENRTSLSTQS